MVANHNTSDLRRVMQEEPIGSEQKVHLDESSLQRLLTLDRDFLLCCRPAHLARHLVKFLNSLSLRLSVPFNQKYQSALTSRLPEKHFSEEF